MSDQRVSFDPETKTIKVIATDEDTDTCDNPLCTICERKLPKIIEEILDLLHPSPWDER